MRSSPSTTFPTRCSPSERTPDVRSGAGGKVRPNPIEQLLHQISGGSDRAQPRPSAGGAPFPAEVHLGQQACRYRRIGPRPPGRQVLQRQHGAIVADLSRVSVATGDGLESLECGRRLKVMKYRGSLALAASAALLAGTAACSSGGGQADGLVTGLAAPCVGAVFGKVWVTVYASHQGTVVKSQRVAATRWQGDPYKLSLPPGSYVISAPQSYLPTRTVSVRSQATTTADFIAHCK